MYKNFDPHKRYFYGVAMAMILAGSCIFALGLVELASNLFKSASFSEPMLKIIGGLVVIALGYIHLEFEMLRIQQK